MTTLRFAYLPPKSTYSEVIDRIKRTGLDADTITIDTEHEALLFIGATMNGKPYNPEKLDIATDPLVSGLIKIFEGNIAFSNWDPAKVGTDGKTLTGATRGTWKPYGFLGGIEYIETEYTLAPAHNYPYRAPDGSSTDTRPPSTSIAELIGRSPTLYY